MPGLDDLIGSLQGAQGGQGGQSGGGLEDILGGILGGSGSGSGGGGLGDILGSVLGGGGGGGASSGGGGLGDILGSVLGGGGGSSSGGGGLGDILGGVLGGAGGGQSSSRSGGAGLGSLMAVVGPLLASLLANGGLQKILGGMKSRGFSEQADSWVSTGENQPIDAGQVREALGDDHIAQVAERLGVDGDQASQVLAQVLPGLVNTVTPDGEEPSEGDLNRLVETLQSFAG